MAAKQRRLGRATAIAILLAAPAEGLRQVAYYDPGGVLTVCRGHTGPDVQKGVVYSLAQCDQYMDDDMRKAVQQVEACVPGLPDNVLAAFSDAVYNIGPRIACDLETSTAARMLRAGDIEGACRQFPRWNKTRIMGVLVPLRGLTKRRNLEMQVCLGEWMP